MPSDKRSRGSLVTATACVVLGWCLHDVNVFAAGGDPADALAILPLSVIWFLALTIGSLLFPRAYLHLVGISCTFGVLLLTSSFISPPTFLESFFRTASALYLAVVAGMYAARWLSTTIAPALAFGLMACAALSWIQDFPVAWLAVGLGSIPLVVAFLTRDPSRRLIATLSALVCLALIPLRHEKPSIRRTADRVASNSAASSRTTTSEGEQPTPAERAPNLLFIVLDTVRADHLGSYGYERDTTPRIDAFFERHGTRFLDARSASSWTLASHGSLFTGRLPSEHQAEIMGAHARALRADLPTLAERLQAAGFATAGIASNLAYFSDRLGLTRGFAHFDNRSAGWSEGYTALGQQLVTDLRVGNSLYRRAEAITDAALAWLARPGDAPFFLFVNYMDAHDPLLPPRPRGDHNEEADAPPAYAEVTSLNPLRPVGEDLVTLYDRSLFYLDHHVGRLLTHLETSGELEDTLVVLTSDHGESLGDHRFRGHGRLLYEGLVHVPLFIKPLGERTAATDERRITAMELHDWVLNAVGQEAPERSEPVSTVSEWRFLRNESPARRTSFERALGRPLDQDLLVWFEPDGLKVIAAPNGTLEVYDLEGDPGEERPLVLDDERVAALRERARDWWAARPVESSAQDEASAAELEAMEDLGYL